MALLLTGCGPTDQEIAVTFLTSVALTVPLVAAINAGLYRLWQDSRDLMPPTPLEAVVVSGVAVTIAAFANGAFVATDGDLLSVGLLLAGSTHLALYSAALGMGLWRKKPWVFRGIYWAPAALSMVLLAPIVVDDNLSGAYNGAVFTFLAYGGGLGLVGFGLLFVLLIVSVVVFRRGRRASGDHRAS